MGWLDGISPAFLADCDCDCIEAVLAAQLIAGPTTERIFGPAANPHSHFMFLLAAPFDGATFEDPILKAQKSKDRQQKSMLIEIRGARQQTVVPPSPYEDGTARVWHRKGDFGKTTFDGLRTWTAKIASAALLARYWPKSFGARMALAGTLARAEWDEEDATAFIAAVIAIAMPGDRDQLHAAKTETRAAFAKVEQNEECYGLSKLITELGTPGKRIAKAITGWLGLKRGAATAANELIVNDRGKVLPIVANAITMLRNAPEWQDVLGFNEFSLFMVTRKPTPWGKPAGEKWTDSNA